MYLKCVAFILLAQNYDSKYIKYKVNAYLKETSDLLRAMTHLAANWYCNTYPGNILNTIWAAFFKRTKGLNTSLYRTGEGRPRYESGRTFHIPHKGIGREMSHITSQTFTSVMMLLHI